MADLEQSLQELESVKQAFKNNISNNGISTSSVEFRNYPNLVKQMEKILPSQTKTVVPTTSSQSVTADSGYKLTGVNVSAIPSEYIIPTGNLDISSNNTYNVRSYETVSVAVPSKEGSVIEMATDEAMHSALNESNLGKVYKFTGTSSTYETDAIYIVSEV